MLINKWKVVVRRIKFTKKLKRNEEQKMKKYVYQPMRYFILTFVVTWGFWLTAIALNSEESSIMIMILGMFSPAVVSIIMILKSKDSTLVGDFKEKCFNLKKCNLANITIAMLIFLVAVGVSILLSVCFGQSLNQFSFAEDFSFTGISILASVSILFFASIVEELGWRGYGVDAIAQSSTWFKATLIFSVLWACWHIPLFWIPGTYQCGLRETSMWFMLNFIVSIMPLAFIITWVYLKNEKNIFACAFIHMFINFVQEKVAMTAITKCVETFVLAAVAIVIVLCNKEMFFEKEHTGNLPKTE